MAYNPQNPNGLTTSANSSPVVIASDQPSLDVALTALPMDSVTKKSVLANTTGDTTLVNPGTGSVRLYFFGYSASPGNGGSVQCALRFGANTAFDNQYLIASQPYARNIGSGRKYLQGAAGESLILNLSASQTVYANIEYSIV